jgi:hypothetical protein
MFKNKREKRYSQERLNNENGRRRRREGRRDQLARNGRK